MTTSSWPTRPRGRCSVRRRRSARIGSSRCTINCCDTRSWRTWHRRTSPGSSFPSRLPAWVPVTLRRRSTCRSRRHPPLPRLELASARDFSEWFSPRSGGEIQPGAHLTMSIFVWCDREAQFVREPEHPAVFGQYQPVERPDSLAARRAYQVLHQRDAEPLPLQVAAHQHTELGAVVIGIGGVAHDAG